MRNEMAQSAYVFMKENLSWQTIAARTHDIYHEETSHKRKSFN